jgi:hypothetical protein
MLTFIIYALALWGAIALFIVIWGLVKIARSEEPQHLDPTLNP